MTQQTAAGLVPTWTVGDRLRKAREMTNLDAGQFADEIGVARNTIGNYEKGRVEARKIVLNAWALRTGVALEWLEHGTVPQEPDGGVPANPEVAPQTLVPNPRRRSTDIRDGQMGDTHRHELVGSVFAA